MKLIHGQKVALHYPTGEMTIVDIYPVGLLAEIQRSWRVKHWRIRPKRIFINLLVAIRHFFTGKWKLAYKEWRPFKSYFNGYLAEPDIFAGKLRRCGSGWTRKRALRDLKRRIRKS